MTTGPDGWWHVIQAYKTFTPVRVRQSLTGGSILDLAATLTNIERSHHFGSRTFPSQGTGNAPWSKARSWKSASVKSLPLAAS
jgi:hypothetical protein